MNKDSGFRPYRLLLAFLLLATVAQAQVLSGTLTGSVLDPTDAAIPGAKVTVVSLSTGQQYSAATEANGTFLLANLPFGFYKVTIEAQGFAKFVNERVQVNVGQMANITAKMQLAKVGSAIVVTGEQATVETQSAEVKSNVDRKQIMDLPLPTRNPLDLVRTMPGIVTPTTSGIADAFVHGLRGNSTNITQDGINVADNFVKTSSFFAISAPTVDTIGEFGVSTSGIGVDAGFGAAQVTMRTQRGQNDVHGSVFWYQRTNAFNANTWFNNAQGRNATTGAPVSPRPFQLQNRIGVNLGGPVYAPKIYNGKNKTWFFGAFEAFREPLSRSRTRTVLSDAARTGSFTYTSGGVTRTVNLLTLTGATIGSTGLPVAINTAAMSFYNSIVPSPNATSGPGCSPDGPNLSCFQFNLPGKGIQNRYTMRLDHQLTKNHSIEFVYNQANFSSAPDLLNGIEPNFPKAPGGSQESKRQVFTWAWHSTWGTNKTNELRGGLQRAPVVFALADNAFADTGGFQLTFPGSIVDPRITSGNLPQGRNTPVRQILDNFSWVKGNHSQRFGGEYRVVLADNFFFNTVIPRVFLGNNTANSDGLVAANFPGGISAGDLARARNVFDSVTGLLGSISQGFNHTSPTSGFVPGKPRFFNPIQPNLSFYWEDRWKIRRNLTLTFGTRYEYQGIFDARNGLVLMPVDGLSAVFGPAGLNNLFTPRTTPVLNDVLLNFAGTNNGRPVYNRDVNNFAPYFGFAWDPWSDGKTSIRGAFSTHYTQDGFTLFSTSVTGNTGLFSVLANNTPAGIFRTTANPTPAAPVAAFPVSQRANFIANTGANQWTFTPDLKVPYVLSWNLSVSRDVWNRISVEARYVGNHSVKGYRSTDYNEINLLNNPFTFGGASVANLLTEFQNAQFNLALSGGGNILNGTTFSPATAGARPLPILSALFSGLSAATGFSNATFVANVQQGQVGAMFDTIRRSNTFRTNREASFPLNFFVPNPFANSDLLLENTAWSYYHGLELEVRRRFASGLFFQGNYTFSKVLTNDRFLTSQNESQAFLSLANRRLDKNRAAFDITHSFAFNMIYPLPFGKGKWLGRNAPTVLDKIIGGWQVQGFTRWSSGGPFTISSGRITTGAFVGQPAVLNNMTAEQLKKQIGVFQTAQGVFWLNPNSGLINITSASASSSVRCTAGQTSPCFAHPGAGESGNLAFFQFNGPSFFNQDLSIIKRTNVTSISENFNFEIRFEFFNAFNHPNFTGTSTGLEASNFGRLTSIVDNVRGGGVTSRIIQWAVKVNF